VIFRKPKQLPVQVQDVPAGAHFLQALTHAATALSYFTEEQPTQLQRQPPSGGNKPPCCIHKRKK